MEENYNLEIFIVDPATGLAILDKRDKSTPIPQPKEELQECIERNLIGISRPGHSLQHFQRRHC